MAIESYPEEEGIPVTLNNGEVVRLNGVPHNKLGDLTMRLLSIEFEEPPQAA